jgi:hypothetical protein
MAGSQHLNTVPNHSQESVVSSAFYPPMPAGFFPSPNRRYPGRLLPPPGPLWLL